MRKGLTCLLVGLQSAVVQLLLEYSIFEEEPPNTFVANLAADLVANIVKPDLSFFDASHQLFRNTLDRNRAIFRISSMHLIKSSNVKLFTEDLFHINSFDSVLRTRIVIDRERYCSGEESCLFRIELSLSSSFFSHLHQTLTVTVEIIDINDNHPFFDHQSIHFRIYESQQVGAKLSLPMASDFDSPSFSIYKYQLIPNFNGTFDTQRQARMTGIDESQFNNESKVSATSLLKEETLFLVLRKPLDRENKQHYQTVLCAVDGGLPSLSSCLDISIEVLDVNDNNPSFRNSTYHFSAREDITPGGVVGQVQADDEDEGLNSFITYRLLDSNAEQSSLASIDKISGVIKIMTNLDFEATRVHSFLVQAIDASSSPLTGFAKVIIHVRDVNDNEPIIELHSIWPSQDTLILHENSPVDTFVAYITVVDTDSEENGRVSCIISDKSGFILKQMNGDRYQLVTGASFDAENESFKTISLACHDYGQPRLQAHLYVRVSIIDVNDCVPEIHPNDRNLSISLVEFNVIGAHLATIRAYDCDVSNTNSDLKFSLNDVTSPSGDATAKLQINLNGTISTNSVFTYGSKNEYLFKIIVFDSGIPQLNTFTFFSLSITKSTMGVSEWRSQSFRVSENIPSPFIVGTVFRPEEDCGGCAYHFQLIRENSSRSKHMDKVFLIDTTTGILTCLQKLDRETEAEYLIEVLVSWKQTSLKVKVGITVEDINDNYPLFVHFPTSPVVLFQSAQRMHDVDRHLLICFHAVDLDSGVNSEVSFEASVSGPDSVYGKYFLFDQANSSSCCLSLVGIWPNATKLFTVAVSARDGGSPPLVNSASLKLILFTPTPSRQLSLKSEKFNYFQKVLPWSLAAVLFVLILSMIISVSCRSRRISDNQHNEDLCRRMQNSATNELETSKHPVVVRTASPDVIPGRDAESTPYMGPANFMANSHHCRRNK